MSIDMGIRKFGDKDFPKDGWEKDEMKKSAFLKIQE